MTKLGRALQTAATKREGAATARALRALQAARSGVSINALAAQIAARSAPRGPQLVGLEERFEPLLTVLREAVESGGRIAWDHLPKRLDRRKR